ncbi:MAG: hypothetical protein ACI8T1_005240 [Verrucomicrobiales bacterium]|jgi:hypothetical protein
MKRISLYLLSLCLCLASCDRAEDQPTAEEMVALAKAEREKREESDNLERERVREANRKRAEARLREDAEEREKLEADSAAAAAKREQADDVAEVIAPEPDEAPEPILDPVPLPDAPTSEDRQLADEKLMDEAIAARKTALEVVGKRQVEIKELQEIARRQNAITGNMKGKKQAEANVARGRARVAAAERVFQRASDRVKTLRNRRLGY